MRKICLVFFVNEKFNCLPIFEQAFQEMGFEVETISLPNIWISELDRKRVNKLKMLLKEKSKTHYVIFSPQSTELFLEDADFMLIFSAYQSWFNSEKMRVIPHLWTPVRLPQPSNHLLWTSKPPLRIGFMGRSYATSRLANIVLKSPMSVKRWLLRGRFLRHPTAIAAMNEFGFSITGTNTFARIETMMALKDNKDKYKDIEFDIAEKQGFSGLENELNEYIHHLEKNTYIVCPRGTENYSFRIYEALSRGRIPVIIDTDVVLPKEINWDELAIKVPYESLDKIFDLVLRDYRSRSESEFLARQKRAITTMAELGTMRWVRELTKELGSKIRSREPRTIA